jgi:hypothetical protein
VYPHTYRNKIVSQKGVSVHNNSLVGIKGMGDFFLDGGKGHQNSYSSVNEYLETTNNVRGEGLAKSFTKKLDNLQIVRPMAKKRNNIKFEM